MRTMSWALLAGLLALPAAGCKNCCRRPFFGDGGLFNRGSSGRASLPAPFAPSNTDPLLIPPPAGGLPSATLDDPPPAATAPASPRSTTPDLPPPTIPESRSNRFEEPGTKKTKELLLPDPLPGRSSKSNGWLEDPAEVRASRSTAQASPKGASLQGVPGFVIVSEGFATGRRPSLEGFDQLQRAGYQSVLWLHAPGDHPEAIRSVAEARGLKFIPVAVAAEDVGSAYERFAREVRGGARPMLVADDTGAKAGALWYAWFRKVDNLSDDAAQVRAAPLGWRDAPEREKAVLLAAVRDFLAKN